MTDADRMRGRIQAGRPKVVVGRIAALLAIGWIALDYARAGIAGALPAGHPWQALALAAGAGVVVLQARPTPWRRHEKLLALALPLCAAGAAWMWLDARRG